MVRLANVEDANQLEILNKEFNGEGETTIENIQDSLLNNRQEIIVVDEKKGLLVGFACIQLKRSFCYNEYMAELTEVYVKLEYRKKGVAREMIDFAEQYCRKQFSCHKFELLTGKNNLNAQMVYDNLGYKNDEEIHFTKKLKK